MKKINRVQNNKMSGRYVVIDVETTGLDYDEDRIIEIGLLRICGNNVEEQFQCLVKSDKPVPADAEKLTGITNGMVDEYGISEQSAFEKVEEFISDSLVVGYNVQFDVNFLQKLGKRVGRDIVIKRTRDVLHIARRELDDLINHKLETVANYFSLDTANVHRALDDCFLTHRIYSELNKL